MELVLDLVLEHADVVTLLDCLFLNKHIHEVVKRVLSCELSLFRKLREVSDDMYEGIELYMRNEWEWFDDPDVYSKNPVCKRTRQMLITIYGRLYKFNVNIDAEYIKVMISEEQCWFVQDFTTFLDLYPHKISLDILGHIFHCICNRNHMCDGCPCSSCSCNFNLMGYLNHILDKGFNVNTLLPIRYNGFDRLMWSERSYTTILNHAIRMTDSEVINILLKKNPNLLMYDEMGMSAEKLFSKPVKCFEKFANTVNGMIKQQRDALEANIWN